MKHVGQTVLPNVYILVHSLTADQEFKCSLFPISHYYSHCMLCPNTLWPRKPAVLPSHREKRALAAPEYTITDSSLHFYLYYGQGFMQSNTKLIFKESTFPKIIKCLPTGKAAEMCLNPHPPYGLSFPSKL